MSDVRLSPELYFERRPLDLRVRAAYIKIFGILDGFRLKLKVKSGKLQKWGSFSVKGLTKTFRRTIYLRRVDFYKFKVNTILKQIIRQLLRDIFPYIIIIKSFDHSSEVRPLIMLLKMNKAVINLSFSLDEIDFYQL